MASFWVSLPVFSQQQAGIAAVEPAVFWGLAPQPASIDHPAKRKRQNTSNACAACRRSKVKCDEDKPCRRCLRDGRHIECVSWRDSALRAGTFQVQPGANDDARDGAGQAVHKKRRRKPVATANGALQTPLTVSRQGLTLPAGVREVKPCGAATQCEQLKEASDLLLSFARECRKVSLAANQARYA